MSKIGLIIQREYLTRVKKRSFIIMTLLTPVLIAAVAIVPTWLTTAMKDDTTKRIVIVDDTNQFSEVLKGEETVTFESSQKTVEELKEGFKDKGYYAVLHITDDLAENPDALTLYSNKSVGMDVKNLIKYQLEKHVRTKKMDAYNIENLNQIMRDLKVNISPETIKWSKDGQDKRTSQELIMGIGFLVGFVMYMFIFMYGVQVMRGVIEEKTNRIVEVMISTVKPFQLMMGKIIGVALVSLTQFMLWVILTLFITMGVRLTMLQDNFSELIAMRDAIEQGTVEGQAAPEIQNEALAKAFTYLGALNFTELTIYFLIFFIGGYLLYSSLFAAVGSAVDNETDTQQFMLPISLPVVLALYVGMAAVNNPHGPVAVWCSMIPLTSPIVMMVRIPFDVPTWQIWTSIGILVITFLGTTALAAKIYRTGILMYGKKITYKELFKWLKYKS